MKRLAGTPPSESISSKMLRTIQPAPIIRDPSQTTIQTRPTCFYDLPAELRIEIYKLVLENVTIHILPPNAENRTHVTHPLVRTSRQVRNEVIPLMHQTCEIRANVTDFNFDGILAWIDRIPPIEQFKLEKNDDMKIRLCTTLEPPSKPDSLRKWLHLRADEYRAQPKWKYSGPRPKAKVANDLRRRAKRMTEPKKREELLIMLTALEVSPS